MMESVVAYDDTRDDEEERRRRRMTDTHAVSTSGRHRGGMDFNDERNGNMITTTTGSGGGSSWIRRRRTTKERGGEGGNDEDEEDDDDGEDGLNGDGGSKSITRRGRESPTSPLPRTRFERGLYPSKGILSPISSIGRQTTTTMTTTPLASSSSSPPPPPSSSSKSVRFETELPNGFPERKPSGRQTPRRASDFAGFGLALDDYPVDDASPCSSLLAVFAVVAFVSWMSTVIHGLFDLFTVAP